MRPHPPRVGPRKAAPWRAPSPSNVVSLDAHARVRARLTPQESAGVLTDCRDLALGRITQALAGVLDQVEDELFELADKARDRDAQNLFLDARVAGARAAGPSSRPPSAASSSRSSTAR